MRSILWLVPGVLLLAVPLCSQNVNPNNPVEMQAQKHASPDDMRTRVNNLQLQQDAKDLAELCAALPKDMDGVKQGLLSKDVLERLKRVEKLSKRVREELMRTSSAP